MHHRSSEAPTTHSWTAETKDVISALGRPRSMRRVLSLFGLLIFVYYFWYTPRSFKFSKSPFYRLPTSLATRDNALPPVLMLSSRLNFWGVYHTIEFPGGFLGFNPSLLPLPYVNDSTETVPNFAVVARGEDVFVSLDERHELKPRSVLASIIRIPEYSPRLLERSPPRELPIVPAPWVTRLKKVVHSETEVYFPKCDSLPEWIQNIPGPEDPRVFWSNLGEPLMIYNSISPTHSPLCRVLYMEDLRRVFPTVRNILEEHGDAPPVRFNRSVPLIFEGQEGIHKNWLPFFRPNGDILIHLKLIPQTIYQMNLSRPLPHFDSPNDDLTSFLTPVVVEKDSRRNCLAIAHPGQKVHQSSPFLDVVLCTTADVANGLCDENDPNNHVYMAVINVVHNDLSPYYYEGRILTFNYSAPYNYISFSEPIVYMGLDQSQLIYTVSIAFRKTYATTTRDFAVGYLDDPLVMSFGAQDKTCHFVEVTVDDVLKNHRMCSDIISEYEQKLLARKLAQAQGQKLGDQMVLVEDRVDGRELGEHW